MPPTSQNLGSAEAGPGKSFNTVRTPGPEVRRGYADSHGARRRHHGRGGRRHRPGRRDRLPARAGLPGHRARRRGRGPRAAAHRPARRADPGPDAARRQRRRPVPPGTRHGPAHLDHHAHRPGRRRGTDRRPGARRGRLHRQTIRPARAPPADRRRGAPQPQRARHSHALHARPVPGPSRRPAHLAERHGDDAHHARVRAVRLPAAQPRPHPDPRRHPARGLGLELRPDVHGHRPRTPAAREDRAGTPVPRYLLTEWGQGYRFTIKDAA